MRSLVAMTILMLVLGACAKTSGVIVAAQPGAAACANLVRDGKDGEPITDQNGEPTRFLVRSLIAGVTSDPGRDHLDQPNPFDQFLDCYVGAVDRTDPEKRLLRAHVLITMLAIYGDDNLGHRRYGDLEDDAALIIRAIENAELSLAAGSRLMVKAAQGPDAEPESVLTSYGRVERVVDVLQVALEVERPTRSRGAVTLRNVAAAVASGGSAGVAGLLLDGLRGIRKAALLELYGGALRNDARRFLAGLDGRPVTLEDWRAWDRWLDRACRSIAASGDVNNRCVPTAQTLAAYLDRGTPPSRDAERSDPFDSTMAGAPALIPALSPVSASVAPEHWEEPAVCIM